VAHTEDDLAQPQQNRGKHGFTDEERASLQPTQQIRGLSTPSHLQQGNGNYTWWSNFRMHAHAMLGGEIDYFLASASLKNNITDATIHGEVMGSDHCPVGLKIVF